MEDILDPQLDNQTTLNDKIPDISEELSSDSSEYLSPSSSEYLSLNFSEHLTPDFSDHLALDFSDPLASDSSVHLAPDSSVRLTPYSSLELDLDSSLEVTSISSENSIEVKEKKALTAWKKLKSSLSLVTKAVITYEQEHRNLIHGINFKLRVCHSHIIKDAHYLPKRNLYITIGGGKAVFFSYDGIMTSEMSFIFDNIRPAFDSQKYIAWQNGSNKFHLLNNSLEVVHTTDCLNTVYLVSFNAIVNEVVIVYNGYVSSWGLQKRLRCLVRKNVCAHNELSQHIPTEIILDNNKNKFQKCFISVDTNIIVFSVQSMKFVCLQKRLHQCRISSMAYFKSYQMLVTGSEDGCIKVWDSEWNVLLVFVGHNDKVVKLLPFPQSIANLVSVSTDETLRVWNLETQEEIRRIQIDKDVTILGSVPDKEELFTCSSNVLFLWKTEHLYNLFMIIGFKIKLMKITNHPAYAQRVVIVSSDFLVRIINPHTGHLITKLPLIPDKSIEIIDTVYAISEDTLFVLLNNGSLMKASTLRNPCEIKSIWTYNSHSAAFSSLVLYEYIANLTQGADMPSALKALTTQTIKSGVMAAPPNTNRTILVAGRFNGYICVLDWFEGTINFQIQAHSDSEVSLLVANPRFDQLISSGKDRVIKIWRFYAFSADCLIPLMSFYCSHTPICMTLSQNFLVVAFKDSTALNLSLVSYDLRNYVQYDQNPSSEHFDQIISLTSCPKLGILASASIDQTIKIWNETNKLIRTLQLEATPESLCFYGEKGDLLVGISHHLYKIPHTLYLPNSYKLKLMSMNIKEPIPDKVIPIDEDKMKKKTDHLCHCHLSRKEKSLLHIYMEKTDALLNEEIGKENAFQVFKQRDNDLQMIQNGLGYQKKQNIKNIKLAAFLNYMKSINKFIGKRTTVEQILEGIESSEVCHRFKEIAEFKVNLDKPIRQPDKAAKVQKRKHRKQVVSEKMMNDLKDIFKKVQTSPIQLPNQPSSVSIEESSSHSTRRSSIESIDIQEFSLSNEVTQLLNEYKKLSSIIMSHTEKENRIPGSKSSVSPKMGRFIYSSFPYNSPRSGISSLSAIQASEIACSLSRVLSRKSIQNASAVHSEETTEFQEYIKEFLLTEWFQKRFSDFTDILRNMLNSTDFILTLLPLLCSNSVDVKINILNIIIKVLTKYGSDNKEIIVEAIVNLLKEDPFISEANEADQKRLVQLALATLNLLHVENDEVIIQYLKHYIYGDVAMRDYIITSLKSFGLGDTSSLIRELDNFSLEFKACTPWLDTQSQLEDWLKKWRSNFQTEIRISFYEKAKYHETHINSPSVSQFLLKRAITEDDENIKEISEPSVTNMEVLSYFCDVKNIITPQKVEPEQTEEPPQKDKPQQKDKLLSKYELPKISLMFGKQIFQPKSRTTLPKHLTRLGETSISVCKPRRETPFYTDFKKPPITHSNYLPHQLKKDSCRKLFYLPISKVNLNPFNTESTIEKGSSLITLQHLPKYFLPSSSIASPST